MFVWYRRYGNEEEKACSGLRGIWYWAALSVEKKKMSDAGL